MSGNSSSNRGSVRVLSIGLDPGYTTGMAILSGGLRAGEAEVVALEQFELDDLCDGWEFVEGSSGRLWWNKCSAAGLELAHRVWNVVDGWLGEGDGSGFAVVTMEDFVLSPAGGGERAGLGGRDAVSPVAIGGAFWGTLGSMVQGDGVLRMRVSSPAAKSVFSDQRLRKRMGDDGWKQWCRGKPHGVDALRHAHLGVRDLRSELGV